MTASPSRPERGAPRAPGDRGRGRLAVLLGPLVAAGPGLAAAETAPTPQAFYERACAECHRSAARVVRHYLDLPAAERAPALDRFLADHYAPNAEERAGLVAWLLANAQRR